MNVTHGILGCAALLLLAACGSPKASYAVLETYTKKDALKGEPVIALARSAVLFDLPADPDGDTPRISGGAVTTVDAAKVVAAVAPDASSRLYRITPETSLFSETKIQIAYRENSTLPEKVNVEFTDKTVTVVQQAAAAVVSVTGLKLFAVERCELKPGEINVPFVISVEDKAASAAPVPGDENGKCWSYTVSPIEDPNSRRAIPREAFEAEAKDAVPVFPYAACRAFTVTLINSGKAARDREPVTLAFPLRGPIPSHVETVALPEKGSIALHSLCGADITQAESKNPSGLDKLKAIIDAVKTVQDARGKK